MARREEPTAPISRSKADPNIAPISKSEPGPAAASVLAACHIGDQLSLSQVTGMGEIDHTADLPRYVPLTGREPQVADPGPAWIVTVRAQLYQPGPGGEVWSGPTCIHTASDTGWYATGPVTVTSTGAVRTPEPPVTPPELRLPPLVP